VRLSQSGLACRPTGPWPPARGAGLWPRRERWPAVGSFAAARAAAKAAWAQRLAARALAAWAQRLAARALAAWAQRLVARALAAWAQRLAARARAAWAQRLAARARAAWAQRLVARAGAAWAQRLAARAQPAWALGTPRRPADPCAATLRSAARAPAAQGHRARAEAMVSSPAEEPAATARAVAEHRCAHRPVRPATWTFSTSCARQLPCGAHPSIGRWTQQ
jgi:hypothetical protein